MDGRGWPNDDKGSFGEMMTGSTNDSYTRASSALLGSGPFVMVDSTHV